MTLEHFIDYRNGSVTVRDPREFCLHDSPISFTERPRVFTTFLAGPAKTPRSRVIPGFDLHLARLAADAAQFGLPNPIDELEEPIVTALEEFASRVPASDSIRARIVLGRDQLEMFFDCFERRYPLGTTIAVRTTAAERPYPESKTTLTETSLAAHEQALAAGCFEVLLVNRYEKVTEGAWSNVFWFNWDGTLSAPDERKLPGVTAALVTSEFAVRAASVSPAELIQAAEVFLTQSTHGITPVGSIDGAPIGDGSPGPKTLALARWYEDVLKR